MPDRKLPLGIALTLVLLGVAVLLFTTRGGSPGKGPPTNQSAPSLPAPALEVFCTSCGQPAVPLDGTVPAVASLTFAYRNPLGSKRLMVLAVDDRQQIYWYHPDPVRSPDSLKIEPSTSAQALPGAIAHRFAGERLTILALFSEEPLFAGKVESLVDASGCQSLRALGGACVEQRLEVKR